MDAEISTKQAPLQLRHDRKIPSTLQIMTIYWEFIIETGMLKFLSINLLN
jgi:hypothetical protein